ncbi:hypothetical protein DXT11_10075 [Escherichia coli]|nr:hypothetical protein [Escherichia coli]
MHTIINSLLVLRNYSAQCEPAYGLINCRHNNPPEQSVYSPPSVAEKMPDNNFFHFYTTVVELNNQLLTSDVQPGYLWCSSH